MLQDVDEDLSDLDCEVLDACVKNQEKFNTLSEHILRIQNIIPREVNLELEILKLMYKNEVKNISVDNTLTHIQEVNNMALDKLKNNLLILNEACIQASARHINIEELRQLVNNKELENQQMSENLIDLEQRATSLHNQWSVEDAKENSSVKEKQKAAPHKTKSLSTVTKNRFLSSLINLATILQKSNNLSKFDEERLKFWKLENKFDLDVGKELLPRKIFKVRKLSPKKKPKAKKISTTEESDLLKKILKECIVFVRPLSPFSSEENNPRLKPRSSSAGSSKNVQTEIQGMEIVIVENFSKTVECQTCPEIINVGTGTQDLTQIPTPSETLSLRDRTEDFQVTKVSSKETKSKPSVVHQKRVVPKRLTIAKLSKNVLNPKSRRVNVKLAATSTEEAPKINEPRTRAQKNKFSRDKISLNVEGKIDKNLQFDDEVSHFGDNIEAHTDMSANVVLQNDVDAQHSVTHTDPSTDEDTSNQELKKLVTLSEKSIINKKTFISKPSQVSRKADNKCHVTDKLNNLRPAMGPYQPYPMSHGSVSYDVSGDDSIFSNASVASQKMFSDFSESMHTINPYSYFMSPPPWYPTSWPAGYPMPAYPYMPHALYQYYSMYGYGFNPSASMSGISVTQPQSSNLSQNSGVSPHANPNSPGERVHAQVITSNDKHSSQIRNSSLGASAQKFNMPGPTYIQTNLQNNEEKACHVNKEHTIEVINEEQCHKAYYEEQYDKAYFSKPDCSDMSISSEESGASQAVVVLDPSSINECYSTNERKSEEAKVVFPPLSTVSVRLEKLSPENLKKMSLLSKKDTTISTQPIFRLPSKNKIKNKWRRNLSFSEENDTDNYHVSVPSLSPAAPVKRERLSIESPQQRNTVVKKDNKTLSPSQLTVAMSVQKITIENKPSRKKIVSSPGQQQARTQEVHVSIPTLSTVVLKTKKFSSIAAKPQNKSKVTREDNVSSSLQHVELPLNKKSAITTTLEKQKVKASESQLEVHSLGRVHTRNVKMNKKKKESSSLNQKQTSISTDSKIPHGVRRSMRLIAARNKRLLLLSSNKATSSKEPLKNRMPVQEFYGVTAGLSTRSGPRHNSVLSRSIKKEPADHKNKCVLMNVSTSKKSKPRSRSKRISIKGVAISKIAVPSCNVKHNSSTTSSKGRAEPQIEGVITYILLNETFKSLRSRKVYRKIVYTRNEIRKRNSFSYEKQEVKNSLDQNLSIGNKKLIAMADTKIDEVCLNLNDEVLLNIKPDPEGNVGLLSNVDKESDEDVVEKVHDKRTSTNVSTSVISETKNAVISETKNEDTSDASSDLSIFDEINFDSENQQQQSIDSCKRPAFASEEMSVKVGAAIQSKVSNIGDAEKIIYLNDDKECEATIVLRERMSSEKSIRSNDNVDDNAQLEPKDVTENAKSLNTSPRIPSPAKSLSPSPSPILFVQYRLRRNVAKFKNNDVLVLPTIEEGSCKNVTNFEKNEVVSVLPTIEEEACKNLTAVEKSDLVEDRKNSVKISVPDQGDLSRMYGERRSSSLRVVDEETAEHIGIESKQEVETFHLNVADNVHSVQIKDATENNARSSSLTSSKNLSLSLSLKCDRQKNVIKSKQNKYSLSTVEEKSCKTSITVQNSASVEGEENGTRVAKIKFSDLGDLPPVHRKKAASSNRSIPKLSVPTDSKHHSIQKPPVSTALEHCSIPKPSGSTDLKRSVPKPSVSTTLKQCSIPKSSVSTASKHRSILKPSVSAAAEHCSIPKPSVSTAAEHCSIPKPSVPTVLEHKQQAALSTDNTSKCKSKKARKKIVPKKKVTKLEKFRKNLSNSHPLCQVRTNLEIENKPKGTYTESVLQSETYSSKCQDTLTEAPEAKPIMVLKKVSKRIVVAQTGESPVILTPIQPTCRNAFRPLPHETDTTVYDKKTSTPIVIPVNENAKLEFRNVVPTNVEQQLIFFYDEGNSKSPKKTKKLYLQHDELDEGGAYSSSYSSTQTNSFGEEENSWVQKDLWWTHHSDGDSQLTLPEGSALPYLLKLQPFKTILPSAPQTRLLSHDVKKIAFHLLRLLDEKDFTEKQMDLVIREIQGYFPGTKVSTVIELALEEEEPEVIEERILNLIARLDKTRWCPQVYDTLLTIIPYSLLHCSPGVVPFLKTVEEMFIVIHLMMQVCKSREDMIAIHKLIYDLLCHLRTKGVQLTYLILKEWPDLFPVVQETENTTNTEQFPIIVQCILNVILNFTPSEIVDEVSKLKTLLHEKYHIIDKRDPLELLDHIIARLRDGEGTGVESALYLLAKRQGFKWSMKNMIDDSLQMLIDNYSSSPEAEAAAQVAVRATGKIVRLVPYMEQDYLLKVMKRINMLLHREGTSHAFQESLVHSLLYLAGPEQIYQLLYCLGTWCPQQPISIPLHNHMKNWAERRLPPRMKSTASPTRKRPAKIDPISVELDL